MLVGPLPSVDIRFLLLPVMVEVIFDNLQIGALPLPIVSFPIYV